MEKYVFRVTTVGGSVFIVITSSFDKARDMVVERLRRNGFSLVEIERIEVLGVESSSSANKLLIDEDLFK